MLNLSLLCLSLVSYFLTAVPGNNLNAQTTVIDSATPVIRTDFIATIDKKRATKDGIYLNGFVVEMPYSQIQELHGKQVRVTGVVTIVKGLDQDTVGVIRQGREADTRHIFNPTVVLVGEQMSHPANNEAERPFVNPVHPSAVQDAKFKVTILYPNGDDKTFNMEYYEKTHMPMVASFLGTNLKSYAIDKGISGRAQGDKPPFLAIGYFYVADIAEYNKAVGQHRDTIIGDFKNYTNIQPVIQISEIRK